MVAIADLPLLSQALARTLEPLEQARTLPRACYTDPAILQLEWKALFGRHWLALARATDLPRAGSYVTSEIGTERVLVVRAHDRELRAFYNVCRHRGARLVADASGQLRSGIVCPYHAWSYGFDGRFRHADGIDPAAGERDLLGLPLAERAGFVFVAFDPQAHPLATALADLPDFSRFGLERLQRVRALDYQVAANWKLVCENYSECYHCTRVHPQLDRLCELSAGGFEAGACFNGGPMQLRAGFDTLSMSGHSRSPRLNQESPADARLVYYYLVYPNLMLGLHPDYLSVHTVWPVAVDACRVRCEILVPPQALEEPGFDAAEVASFWDLTNRQDWALCERVQRGAGSQGYRPGPYHPAERCVHAFDRWYARWLLAAAS